MTNEQGMHHSLTALYGRVSIAVVVVALVLQTSTDAAVPCNVSIQEESFASSPLQDHDVNVPASFQQEQRNPGPFECSLYMAPSTLGIANMGMFTGVDMIPDDVVNFPEIVIPLLFREWGEHPEGFTDGELWHKYIWEGIWVDLETYQDTDASISKAGFIPGIGCTINGMLDMMNCESTHGSVYDTTGLHRSKDPGSGAFSPYHGSVTTAAIDIPAGSELFAAYGDTWIPKIPGAQVTFDTKMDRADDFLRYDYIPFVQAHQDEMSLALQQGLWNFTRNFPIYSKAMTNLPREEHSWSDIQEFLQNEEAKQSQDNANENEANPPSITRHFIRKQSLRTLEWLQNHPNSYCQDHIRPQTSTIPQAGRGAFANRDLQQGSVVGYAPLIHVGIDGRALFHIEYTNVGTDGTRHAYDLIINYSFYHKNSTMILTPYGGMVNYINHASDGRQPNVKVRFPDKELVAHKPEWLDKDPEFFHHATERIGLSFEYVALRDIVEGEEVLMDYGPEWEAAWKQHLEEWEPLQDAQGYQHSTDYNQTSLPFFKTREELEVDPYPDNLHTMCIASYAYEEATDIYVFIPVLKETTFRWYCHVIERKEVPTINDDNEEKASYEYTVQIFISSETDDDDDDDDDEEEYENTDGEWITVHGYSTDAIFLKDKAFSTDWHLPGAFRHPIAIPDDIMPLAWQNGPDPFELPIDDDFSDENSQEFEESY